MNFTQTKRGRQKMMPINPGALLCTKANQKNYDGTYIQARQQIWAVINGIRNRLSPDDTLIFGKITTQVHLQPRGFIGEAYDFQ